MAAIEVYQDISSTQVNTGGTDAPAAGTQQTWTVASSASFPAVSSTGAALPWTGQPTQFHVSDPALASEIVTVINISGLTWTVIRGAEGTTPVPHAAGFTVKQVVTVGGLGQVAAGLNGWCAPGAVVAETFPRVFSAGSQVLTSGTLSVVGISLPQYLTVTAITMAVKATVAATQTNGWFVILDSGLVVRGVTANQTTAGPTGLFGTANTPYSLNLAAPYVTTYTGLYYIGVNQTAGTAPTVVTCTPMASALTALTPVLCGTVSTGYSATPPAVTTALSGLSANNNMTIYAGIS